MAAAAGCRVNIQQRIDAVESALQRRLGADEPLNNAARPVPGFDAELSRLAHELLERVFGHRQQPMEEALAEVFDAV